MKLEPLSPQWLLMKFFENWTANDFQYLIKNNKIFNLRPFWGFIENAIVDFILSMFKETRPDLYAVLNTYEGREWLKKNIRAIFQK